VPEVKSRNLDADWIYRKLSKIIYAALDKGLNSLNRSTEGVLMTLVKGVSRFFQQATTNTALFFAVNLWLLQGYRDKRLAYKKERLYNDIMEGTLPIGVGAAVAISFIILVFALT